MNIYLDYTTPIKFKIAFVHQTFQQFNKMKFTIFSMLINILCCI